LYFDAVQERIFDLTRSLADMDDLTKIRQTQGAAMALQSILDVDFAEDAADAN
jgi:hypothetical protein